VGHEYLQGDQIQELRRVVDVESARSAASQPGSVRSEEVIDRYVDDVVARIGPLSRPLRVVVDCGNGAGSLVAGKLFRPVAVNASYLFCESDGTFPNTHTDPHRVENLHHIIGAVRSSGADIGIAFDGDADRIG